MIELKHIQLSYHKILINDGNLKLPNGSITAIIGKSGLGKTTLLNQVGFIDPLWNEHCEYYLNGTRIEPSKEIELYRNNYFYLFQNNNLVDEMTCYDNILFLASMRGITLTKEEIFTCFEKFHVDIDLSQYPAQVSGGQRQKLEVAILSLIHPKVILCDEITSALDHKSALEIYTLLKEIVKEIEATCVLVVHDPKIIELCDNIYEINDHQLIKVKYKENSNPVILESTYKITLRTYLTYMYLKLMNKDFLRKSIVVGVLFSLMITSFNLIYRYNQENKDKLSDSLSSYSNQEFIYDECEDLSFEGIPYYQYEETVEDQKVTIHINASNQEIEKYLVYRIIPKGAYINVSYADALGITSSSVYKSIILEGKQINIAGVIEDDYYQGNNGYHIYFLDNEDVFETSHKANYRMYFASDIEELQKICEELEKHDIMIYSEVANYTDMLKHNQQIDWFIDLLLIAVILILVVFSIIYSIIQYEAKGKEITLLYHRGFRLGSLSCLNISENIPVLLMILIISPLLSNGISNILVGNGIFMQLDHSFILIYLRVSFLIAGLVILLSQFMISFIYIRRNK